MTTSDVTLVKSPFLSMSASVNGWKFSIGLNDKVEKKKKKKKKKKK